MSLAEAGRQAMNKQAASGASPGQTLQWARFPQVRKSRGNGRFFKRSYKGRNNQQKETHKGEEGLGEGEHRIAEFP